MQERIKFGTDGWRAIIAQEYTIDNLIRVASATARFALKHGGKKVVVGYDCRFGGKLFMETVARVMGKYGIECLLSRHFVSTPMVSLAVVRHQAFLGIVVTASHNPPEYNGFKIKASYGGPSVPADIAEVESLIQDLPEGELPALHSLEEDNRVQYIDMETLYLREVEAKFDLNAIRHSHIRLAYDAMYGTGQNIMRRILPGCIPLHCEHNPSFYGQAPEPIHRNLTELSDMIKNNPSINCGLANDGDADRIGLYDEEGNFVDSHQILLLLIHYLHKYKGMTGKVVVTFSVTDKVRKLCALYGLPCQVTAIGFKYIAEIMLHESVLVGGEESGGIAAAGHIPERDGIWVGLLLLEFMAKTGKTLRRLMQEIYDLVGHFAFDRDDLHLDNERKERIVELCRSGKLQQIGSMPIVRTETTDGFKFYVDEGKWVMIRPSGTEPILRVYAEAPTAEQARELLDATHYTLSAATR